MLNAKNEQGCKKEVFHNLNFLRFMFALFVVYIHISHSAIMPFVSKDSIYWKMQYATRFIPGVVECFFMITGFFFFRKYEKGFTEPVHSFIFDKYIRLMPVLLVALLLSVAYSPQTLLMYLSLLNCMGMGWEDQAINWYISVFFYGSIFYYALYSIISKEKAFFLTCILTYLGFTIVLSSGQGKFHSYSLPYGLSLGLLRAIAGIGAGIIFARLLGYMTPLLEKIFTNQRFRTVFFTLSETIALAMLVNRFLLGEKFPSQIIVVLLFSIILGCFILNYGLLSRLLNHPFSSELGKYSYSIYVMQQVTYSLFIRVIWPRCPVMVNNTLLCVSSVLILSVILGIAAYHWVEVPSVKWYKKLTAKV